MRSRRVACGLVLAGAVSQGHAATVPTPAEIVAGAPESAWRAVDPARMLVMRLAGGRRVVLELAPAFAPVHVANVLALARAHWWDGASIVRVQDDYVVQWARMPEGQRLPRGVVARPPAEVDRDAGGIAIRGLGTADPYARQAGFWDGWPVAGDGTRTWLVHCYGMVGAGRDMPPDTGDGTELYAVNGQAPRQLDRNLALVGRVVDGMGVLGALPRGAGAMGYYASPVQRVPIVDVRVGADLPAGERPRVDVMRTDSDAFGRYLEARRNRRDPFYVREAGAVDECNVPVPDRVRP